MLKKLVYAALITGLLIGLVVIDGTQLLGEVSNSQIGESQISCSASALPKVEIKKAWYGDNGEFLGCYSSGNNCVVIVLTVAGVEREIMVASGGVLLR